MLPLARETRCLVMTTRAYGDDDEDMVELLLAAAATMPCAFM